MQNHIITKMKPMNRALEDEKKHLVKAVVAGIEKNKSTKEKLIAVELEKEDINKNLMETIHKCTKLKGQLRYEIFDRRMMKDDFQEEVKNLTLFIKEVKKSAGNMKQPMQIKSASTREK